MSNQQDQARDEAVTWREFGVQLERLRLDRGLSVVELARQSGVSRDLIHKIENGGYREVEGGPWVTPNPRDEKLHGLARALGVEVEAWFALVGRYDDRPRTRRSARRGFGHLERGDRIRELEERIAVQEAALKALEAALREAGVVDSPPAKPKPVRRRRAAG